MKRHAKGAAAALAVLAIAGVAAVASAHDSPELSDAGAANTKTPGVTLPDKLSPQLREITVAQGSNVLENPSTAIGYYGYYNDGPLLPAPGAVQSPGHNVEATKSEPDKNTYLVVDGQHGADASLRLRHPLPLPGPRAGGRLGRELHHADQPRRRRGPPRHEARGVRVRRHHPGTADRRLDMGSVRTAAPLHDRGRRDRRHRRGDARLPVEGHPALGHPRPGRLRGHSERQRREHLHRRGLRRPAPARSTHTRSSRTASCTGSFPTTRPTSTRAASSRSCRSTRSPTPARSSSTRARPTPTSSRRTSPTCTPTARRSRRRG